MVEVAAAVAALLQRLPLRGTVHQQDHARVDLLRADHRLHQDQKILQEEVSRMDGADLPVNQQAVCSIINV